MIGAMFQEMSMTKPPKKQVSDDGHYSTVMYVWQRVMCGQERRGRTGVVTCNRSWEGSGVERQEIHKKSLQPVVTRDVGMLKLEEIVMSESSRVPGIPRFRKSWKDERHIKWGYTVRKAHIVSRWTKSWKWSICWRIYTGTDVTCVREEKLIHWFHVESNENSYS